MMDSPRWCKWIDHSGPIVGSGNIVVTCKKNVPDAENLLPGRWWIRKCKRCGETFSHSDDIVVTKDQEVMTYAKK